MSELILAPDSLANDPATPTRKLRGNLGVASIVFMVVAAAAPLGVIGGVVPLGIASGNGVGFPATFIVATVILSFHNVASRYVFALSQRDVAISVILAVVFGLDPAAQFYTWFAGATTVGIVILLIATSVAVLVYFGRDRHGYPQWRVRIAPSLGLVGLVGSLILILANLKDLVGGSSILAWVIVGLLVGAFALGAAIGTRVSGDTVGTAAS